MDDKFAELTIEQLAQLYDNMLERKILNGTEGDPFAVWMLDVIGAYVRSVSVDFHIAFMQAHDDILRKQLLGE